MHHEGMGCPLYMPRHESEQKLMHLAMWPSVNQVQPNDAIAIYDGDMEIITGNRVMKERGQIKYSFLPSIETAIEIVSPTDLYGMSSDELLLRIPSASTDVTMGISRFGFSIGKGNAPIVGFARSPICFGIKERLGRVRFHLLNFNEFHGERIYRGNQEGKVLSWPGRAYFDMGPWRVTLDSMPDISERIKQARAVGGYVITHVGNLERREKKNGIGRLFGANEASKALEVLYYVFTLANGSRCPCVLPYGYRHMPSEVSRCVMSFRKQTAHDFSTYNCWIRKP
jgi:hypothetical protein